MSHKKKPSGPENVKAEYLKRMNSPIYRKSVKRSMNALMNYNMFCRNSTLKLHELRSIAKYFADDIKNPVIAKYVEVDNSDNVIQTALKPIKI